MRGTDFIEKINDIDTSLLEAAEKAPQKKTKPWIRLGALAACMCLMTVGYVNYRLTHTVDSIITLDVNPSIEITANTNNKVLSVIPLNEDGKEVIGSMSLEGYSLEVSVNALIGSMLSKGYIDEASNSILVTVDNNDSVKGEAIKSQLTTEIKKFLEKDSFQGAIISQLARKDQELEDQAHKYGITLGKAQVITQIISQSTRYRFEDLAPLSINEINLLCGSSRIKLKNIDLTGSASDREYISEDKAKAIALAEAGLKEEDLSYCYGEMEYERGVMVYEFEFEANGIEFEYDINAMDGSVVKYKTETKDVWYDNDNETDDEEDKDDTEGTDDADDTEALDDLLDPDDADDVGETDDADEADDDNGAEGVKDDTDDTEDADETDDEDGAGGVNDTDDMEEEDADGDIEAMDEDD